MSISVFVAVLLTPGAAIAAPPIDQPVEQVEVGYVALTQGDPAKAINTIKAAGAGKDDPVALINLAAANARLGRIEEARRLLQAARVAPDRFDVQLADGRWMDSRDVARLADAALVRQQALALR